MKNVNKKIASITMAACLGLSLASCTASGSGSISPNATSPSVSQNNSTDSSFQTSSLAVQAQTALANYHNIDGAFSDSARLSGSGSFSTQQLTDTLNDTVDTVSDTISDTTSGSGSASTSVSTSVSGSTDSGSTNTSLNAEASVDGGSSTGSTTNVSTTSTGINAGVNLNTGTDSTGTGLNAGVDAGLNGSTSASNSLLGDLSLNTDINSDISSTMSSMQSLNAELRSNLESTGSVRFTEDNISIINEGNLQTSINNDINSAVDNDLLSFNNNSILQPNGRLNFSGNVEGMAQIAPSQLLRTGDRGFTTSAGTIRSQTNADGSVTSFFATSFDGDTIDQNVLVADRTQGNLDLGSDLMLTESGDGFFTQATRVSSRNADGSLKVVTRATTNFDNGDRIEILEERMADVSGAASGNGTLTLTDASGNTQSFDLRTMTNVDGSFVSNLQADNNAMDTLVIRENASGDATLSLMTDANVEANRTNVDFNAMMDAMANFDFS